MTRSARARRVCALSWVPLPCAISPSPHHRSHNLMKFLRLVQPICGCRLPSSRREVARLLLGPHGACAPVAIVEHHIDLDNVLSAQAAMSVCAHDVVSTQLSFVVNGVFLQARGLGPWAVRMPRGSVGLESRSNAPTIAGPVLLFDCHRLWSVLQLRSAWCLPVRRHRGMRTFAR